MQTSQYNQNYISKIDTVIRKSLIAHNRTSVIRIDLRFPTEVNFHSNDSKAITRFIESLKAKIDADLKRKSNKWGRHCSSHVNYIWVKEIGEKNNNKHYHVLLLVNKDIYHTLGNYDQDEPNLGILIQQAWCSAINAAYPENRYLAHFPDNPTYWLDAHSPEIEKQISALNERCLYLAKHHTKQYGEGERSFGCSR